MQVMSNQRYCLHEPILSVATAQGGRKSCLYVPAGEVISVEGQTGMHKEMVQVAWDTQKLLMFQSDIEDRAEPVFA
jgi:hypothetical protein